MITQELQEYILQASIDAAVASYAMLGCGDEHAADQAAVDAMRRILTEAPMAGEIVIGEGERDKAPMLYIGEKLGRGGDAIDIAVDPLEGTTLCAYNMNGAMSTIAIAPKSQIFASPDVYMKKLVVGQNCNIGDIDIDEDIKTILQKIARGYGKAVRELMICVLDRPRHAELITGIRSAGARIKLIKDGDISAAILAAGGRGIDAYMGTGGAPEGVLVAAAIKVLGGSIFTKLCYEPNGFDEFGGEQPQHSLLDMIKGEILFIATGITDGDLLASVKFKDNNITTESLVLRGYYDKNGVYTKVIRTIVNCSPRY